MVRLALHFFGVLILAGGFAVLVIDATRSFAAGRLIVTQCGQTAAALAPAQVALLQMVIDQRAHPLLGGVLANFLTLPTSLVMAAAAALLFWLAREPRRKIGFSSR